MTEQWAVKRLNEIVYELTEGELQIYSQDYEIACNMAIKALELQTPKEPLNKQGIPLFGYCPRCGTAIYKWLNRLACKECLQRLKWE